MINSDKNSFSFPNDNNNNNKSVYLSPSCKSPQGSFTLLIIEYLHEKIINDSYIFLINLYLKLEFKILIHNCFVINSETVCCLLRSVTEKELPLMMALP